MPKCPFCPPTANLAFPVYSDLKYGCYPIYVNLLNAKTLSVLKKMQYKVHRKSIVMLHGPPNTPTTAESHNTSQKGKKT